MLVLLPTGKIYGLFPNDNTEDGESHNLIANTTSLTYSPHCNPVESVRCFQVPRA